MLDIGCGEGFFLDHFHKKGLDVHGIDFNTKLVEGFFHIWPNMFHKET